MFCKISSTYFILRLKKWGPFHLFFFRIWTFWTSAKPQTLTNAIWQYLRLGLVTINVYAKCYQNIPYGSRVMGNFLIFHNLDLGKASTNGKWYLTNPLATSCQYQCVCEISSKYSTRFKRQGQFHFFTSWTSVQPRPMKNDIWQSLGLVRD